MGKFAQRSIFTPSSIFSYIINNYNNRIILYLLSLRNHKTVTGVFEKKLYHFVLFDEKNCCTKTSALFWYSGTISTFSSLTYTRVDPQQSLPAQTVVQLGHVRALAGTSSPQIGTKDSQNGRSAFCWRSGALLGDAVHRTGLFVVF